MRHPLAMLVATLVSVSAFAGSTAKSATTQASALIVPPIKISKLRDLWFGELILHRDNFTGSLQIDQTADVNGGQRSADQPGFTTVVKKFEPWHNAEFQVTGWADAAFAMSLSEPRIILTNQDGATTSIDLVKFNRYHEEAIGSDGKATVWIGGRLTMDGLLTPGMYSGSFEVHVNYN